jgi:hypothetical protein
MPEVRLNQVTGGGDHRHERARRRFAQVRDRRCRDSPGEFAQVTTDDPGVIPSRRQTGAWLALGARLGAPARRRHRRHDLGLKTFLSGVGRLVIIETRRRPAALPSGCAAMLTPTATGSSRYKDPGRA